MGRPCDKKIRSAGGCYPVRAANSILSVTRLTTDPEFGYQVLRQASRTVPRSLDSPRMPCRLCSSTTLPTQANAESSHRRSRQQRTCCGAAIMRRHPLLTDHSRRRGSQPGNSSEAEQLKERHGRQRTPERLKTITSRSLARARLIGQNRLVMTAPHLQPARHPWTRR